MKPLSQLRVGERGVVESIRYDAPSTHLLSALGLIPGTSFEVKCRAPLGDPIELEVRGYRLSLRKNEAQRVTVEPLAPASS